LRLKPPKDKPNSAPKFATAVLLFKKVEDAFGAVGASGREERNLKDVQVDWVGGEPEYVKKLRETGVLGGTRTTDSSKIGAPSRPAPFDASFFTRSLGRNTSTGGAFSSFPDMASTLPSHTRGFTNNPIAG